MYSHVSPAATASTVARAGASTEIVPLDRERFEHLTEAEAVLLLSSRFRCFIERGWTWNDALQLAVRPDRAPEGVRTPLGGCAGTANDGRYP